MIEVLVFSRGVVLLLLGILLFFKTPNRYWFYRLVVLLFVVSVFGSWFEVLHLPGGVGLSLVGFLAYTVSAVIFLWNGIARSDAPGSRSWHFLVGLLVVAVLVLSLLWPEQERWASLLAFPLLALVATILWNRKWTHGGERSLLVFVMADLVFNVAVQLVRMAE